VCCASTPSTTRRPRSSSWTTCSRRCCSRTIQTENNATFQAGFHWHVLDRGLKHTYIRPATPRRNGEVERSHRIDDEELKSLLDSVVLDDNRLFTEKLQEWENFYNFNWPSAASAGRLLRRLAQKTKTQP
jgi:transposase InsO family protein